LKYLWAIPALAVFLAYFCVEIPLMLAGFVLVSVYGALPGQQIHMASPKYADRTVLAWKPVWLQALWGNWQNGIDGTAGDDLPEGWPHLAWWPWLQIFGWSAWRNKVGNERWTTLLGMAVDPAKVRVCFSSELPVNLRRGYFLVRQGWRFQFRWTYSATRQLRLGWGIAEQGGATPLGVGFSTEPAAATV